MIDLKPCPFCGGEARISNTEITRYNAGRTEKIKIECSVCDAKIEATRHERTAAYTSMNGTVIIVGTGVFDGLGAIEQWNRRVSDGNSL